MKDVAVFCDRCKRHFKEFRYHPKDIMDNEDYCPSCEARRNG